jgi:hypothetical protein
MRSDTSPPAAGEPVDDVGRLQRNAAALETNAEVVTRVYNRSSWVRFVLFFFPAPLIVVLFRLYLEAWGYYALGALFIVSGAVLFAVDGAAAAKRDAAIAAAERARQAFEEARRQA